MRAIVVNPPLGNSCGLDIALLLDFSGSIDAAEMAKLKSAMITFVSAFEGTPTQFSVSKFSNVGFVLKPFPLTATQAINSINNDVPNVGSGYTNWDDGLAKAYSTFDPRPAKQNLIIIGTDGNPNRYGNPSTPASGRDPVLGLSYGISRADAIKAAGTRIVAIGIGNDLNINNLKAITGDNVLPPGTITKDTDVITADFSELAQVMSDLSQALCGGKILIQSQFDTDGDGLADVTGSTSDPLLSGWEYDVNGTPSSPDIQITSASGALEFGGILNGIYSVWQTNQKPGTKFVNASCVNGSTPVGTPDLENKSVFDLVMDTDDTILCNFINQYLPASLTVIKHVVNDNGGSKIASDFTMNVTGANVSPIIYWG